MDIETLSLTAIAGVFVGILAGLFGVGGGIIVVPVLTFVYRKLGFPNEIIAHSAIGTSLATIFFTSLTSLYTHHKKQAVLFPVVGVLVPGIVLGVYGGAFFASALKSQLLIGIFIFFIFVFSIRMLFSGNKTKQEFRKNDDKLSESFMESHESKPKVNSNLSLSNTEFEKNSMDFDYRENLPSRLVQSIMGLVIGFSSAIVGVGGGVFTSTYLLHYRTPIHLAIGTSAAIGFPIAIAGSLSYISTGWNHPLLPEGSVGFVYLPALFGIVLGSIPFAYIGASLSHKIDKVLLKKIFAIFLMCMGIAMMVM